MHDSVKHPLTLRFLDADLETHFIRDYIDKSRRPIEIGIIAGLIVYGLLFGIMDWVQSTNALSQILWIRAVVCVLGILVMWYSKYAKDPQYLHEAVSFLIFVAGLGLLTMILLDNSVDAYLEGPVLLILPAYVLFRLRFIYASVVGILLFVLYCIVIYFLEGMRATDLWASAIFLFAANLIGMVAGYALENYARKEFWQTMVIDKERKANAELLEVKNRFFANISHEIRTPLTLIVGPLDDLLNGKDNLPAHVARVLKAALKSGDRLLKFINQLLDLSRLDAEQVSTTFHRTDLVVYLDALIETFQPFAASKGISLQFIHEAEEIEFVSDYEIIEIIVSNLVSNAVKYTPAGGAVRVAVKPQKEGGMLIEVKDTGAGIPASALPHIFDRFYRVPATADTKIEGLGLGLSLTKAMVAQLSGEIEVKSEEGLGSLFTVTLPPVAPQSTVIALEKPARDHHKEDGAQLEDQNSVFEGSPEATERASVLIVEDDDSVRAYLQECLSTYDTFEAHDGITGLRFAAEHMPDIIVSDLMMPRMDGQHFVQKIRSDMMLSHIPFIMLTANVSEEARLANLEDGVDDFLTKPFNKRELQLRIRNMLASRQRAQRINRSHVVMEPALEEVQSSERVFLQRLQQSVDQHLGEEHFNADALADELGVSVRQLQRKAKALLDETPTALIRIMRLKKAAHLLEGNYGGVSEVAYAVGFNNPAYFTKCFREYFGEAPSNWKKQ
ncbi:MAG: ATP-binding protein [Rhodothermales bacterium]